MSHLRCVADPSKAERAVLHVCEYALSMYHDGIAKVCFHPCEGEWLLITLSGFVAQEDIYGSWEDLLDRGEAWKLLQSSCYGDYDDLSTHIQYCPWCGERLPAIEEPSR